MPANIKVCSGFRSASRVVSEPGRDGSATAIVAAVELLALSKANAPETSATTAIKIAIFLYRFLSWLFWFSPASQKSNDSQDRWHNLANISSAMLSYWLISQLMMLN